MLATSAVYASLPFPTIAPHLPRRGDPPPRRLAKPTRFIGHAQAEVLTSRFGGHRTEDQCGGEAAGVPAHRHAADLDPGGVETGERAAVRPAQHAALSVHREPAPCANLGGC